MPRRSGGNDFKERTGGLVELKRMAGPVPVKKFKKIYIEITNCCNLACSFCQPSCRPKAFMRPSSFAEILGKISGSTDYISLHVLGEALLHPDLGLFLAMSREYGLQVNLSTNGVLLSRKRSVLIGQPALRQINISLQSFEQSGQESALDAYMDEIFDFIAAAVVVPSLLINLRMWNLQPDAVSGEPLMSRRMFRRLENYFRLPDPIPEYPAAGRGITLAPRIFLSRERRFTWPHVHAPDLGAHGNCRGLHDHIAILVDGTVVPCCLDGEGDIPLGNILQSTLPEILADSRAARIREGFARQRVMESLCRRCSYKQRFQHRTLDKAV